MTHQRGELNAPSVWSNIRSAFSSQPSNSARLDALERKVAKIMVKLDALMVEVAEQEGAIDKAIQLIGELKALIQGEGDAQAKIDTMAARLDAAQKALEAASDAGGSQGGIV